MRSAGAYLCDIAYDDCREEVLTLIRNETVGIDLSFWFMTDARYSNAIVSRWHAGVPVRVIMDPRANTSKPANAAQLSQLEAAGIPMLNKPFGDIAHWKGMIFAGSERGGVLRGELQPLRVRLRDPVRAVPGRVDLNFSNEPDVVQSLMRRFDDVWMNDVYTFYANPVVRVRSYPESYTIAPEFNLPPDDSYTSRLLPLLDAETEGIDVVMFRITDPRPADALIRAVARGVPVRLYAEPLEYRNPARREDAYNVDRMYMAGVRIRMRAHAGQNHQKTVQLAGQHTTIFGTSNWSTASDRQPARSELLHDEGLVLSNSSPTSSTGSGTTGRRTDRPRCKRPTSCRCRPTRRSTQAPANLASGVSPGSVTLSWYAGDWARKYDLYWASARTRSCTPPT